MTIDGVNIIRVSNGENLTVSDTYDNVTHFWVLSLNTNAEEETDRTFRANEEYLITANYTGNHRDDMYGFYRSSYRDVNDATV
jgi:hypothetical protein